MEYFGLLNGISSLDSESFEGYVKSLQNQISISAEDAKNSDDAVKTISSLLMKPQGRQNGLLLLSCFIDHCPSEVLETKLSFWTVELLKSCTSSSQEIVASACSVLAKLVTKARDVPTFAANHLPKVYETLANVIPDCHVAALRCMEVCLKLYPGPSAPSRTAIERHLLRFVDSHNRDISCCVAKCLLMLQQVRGGSAQGVSQKTMWERHQLRLLSSLNRILDKLFEKCPELYENSNSAQEEFNVAALVLSDEPIRRVEQLGNRFSNLIIYLMTAICEEFPVEKPIKPKALLNFIARGLSMTCMVLHRTGVFDNLAAAALLPQMHLQLVQLLHTVLLTLGSHAKMYQIMIVGILNEALKLSTCKSPNGGLKQFVLLRIKVYGSISLFCSSLPNSCGNIFAETIISEIVKDITPMEQRLDLTIVLNGGQKGHSKKARRQMQKTQNSQSSLGKQYSSVSSKNKSAMQLGHIRTCTAALGCLQQLVNSTAHCLKPATLKMLQLKLVKVCGLLYDLPMSPQHLYFDQANRLELYRVLWSLYVAPANGYPLAAQLIGSLLQNAHYNDESSQIRQQCQMLLQYLEKTIHPSKESLSFPLNAAEINRDLYNADCNDLLEAHSNVEETNGFRLSDAILEISHEHHNQQTDEPNVVSVDSTSVEDSMELPEVETRAETKQSEHVQILDIVELPLAVLSATSDHTTVDLTEPEREPDLLQPPLNKKLKLNESSKSTHESIPKEGEVIQQPADDELLGDIEATFVNELK